MIPSFLMPSRDFCLLIPSRDYHFIKKKRARAEPRLLPNEPEPN